MQLEVVIGLKLNSVGLALDTSGPTGLPEKRRPGAKDAPKWRRLKNLHTMWGAAGKNARRLSTHKNKIKRLASVLKHTPT